MSPNAFTVEVIYDRESRMWVAECGALCIVTEAPSYEALIERVWEVAPEIAALNGVQFDATSLLRFEQLTTSEFHV